MDSTPALQRRGRPAIPESNRLTKTANLRMTAAQAEILKGLGGTQWLREQIDKSASNKQGLKSDDRIRRSARLGLARYTNDPWPSNPEDDTEYDLKLLARVEKWIDRPTALEGIAETVLRSLAYYERTLRSILGDKASEFDNDGTAEYPEITRAQAGQIFGGREIFRESALFYARFIKDDGLVKAYAKR